MSNMDFARVPSISLISNAGQEKYNSISRQFLRKADGVVIMYDVTSETSFIRVRYWIDSIRVCIHRSILSYR